MHLWKGGKKGLDQYQWHQSGSLTAGHFDLASLPVQWIILEIHWTGQCQRETNRVQNISIWIDTQQYIWHDNLVKVALLLIRKEQIRFPNFTRICQHQILDTAIHVIELQTIIVPKLSERDLTGVFLEKERKREAISNQ